MSDEQRNWAAGLGSLARVIENEGWPCSAQLVLDAADEIERLTAEVTDLRGRGSYLVAEVKDEWDRGRISVDTYHAALALEQITDSGRQEQNDG